MKKVIKTPILNPFQRKGLIELILTALFLLSFGKAGMGYAQTFPYGINYQAVARNANGNAINTAAVNLRFTIAPSTSTTTIVYQETQSATTNSMGQFNAVIGTGSSSQTFSNVAWQGNAYNLIVEINPGSGYVIIGNQPFQSVPYALATPIEQFAVYQEYYAYPGSSSPSSYGFGGATSIPINTWTGTSSQSYIPLTEQTPSNTPAISFSAGIITLAPGTYMVRATTHNDIYTGNTGGGNLKSRIINSGGTMIAEGSTSTGALQGTYASSTYVAATLYSTIDQVFTITGSSTTIQFQRYQQVGGGGTCQSQGIQGFSIVNEGMVLSKLYIKKLQ